MGHPEKPNPPSVSMPTAVTAAAGLTSAILADIYTILYGCATCADYHRDLATLERRAAHEGISFFTQRLPVLMAGLLEYLETHKEPSFPGFKTRNRFPIFMGPVFRDVFSEHTMVSSLALEGIYQISVAFKKLRGPYSDAQLMKQYNELVEVDKNLPKVFPEDILQSARYMINTIFHGYDPLTDDNMKPCPGPGATNKKVEKHLRWEPHQVFGQIASVFPYEEWFYSHPWEVVQDSKRFLHIHHKSRRKKQQTSRLVYVQKKIGQARGICCEENEAQFLQQAVKRSLYEWIENSPARGHINFSDQGINRDLALNASLTRCKATIDMSEASNRVPRILVSRCFVDQADLLTMLLSLSTRRLTFKPPNAGDVNPYVLDTNMYAPMGSGLCFPVMSLIHYVLVASIVKLYHNVDIRDSLYVYGDDIIMPSEYVDVVYRRLPIFGMKVNTTKSYKDSYFRESCGIHAYKGVDITPIFMKYIQKPQHTKVLVSWLQNEYSFFKKGYEYTAATLRKMCGKQPYVTKGSSALGFMRDHLSVDFIKRQYKRRWSKDLQQFEYKIMVARPFVEVLPPLSSSAGYLRYLCKSARVWKQPYVNGDAILSRGRVWVNEPSLGMPVDFRHKIPGL